MQKEIKPILKVALEAMDQGRFQEFSKSCMPALNANYKDLQRFGGTAEEKTRKGTPDLLKTNTETAKQIAVQCSVDKNYWKSPEKEEDYGKWKPCEDIDKCMEKLTGVEEIVLCSNQEIPLNDPNVERKIISYAKKYNVKITLVNLTIFENCVEQIASDPSQLGFLKQFFPTVYDLIQKLEESNKYRTQIEIYKKHTLPFQTVEAIVNEVFNIVPDSGTREELINQRLNTIASKFEFKPDPFQGIIRILPSDYPLLHPTGRIISLTGVPKIGKTFVALQCIEVWKKDSPIEVRIYITPFDTNDRRLFIQEFIKSIYSLIIDPLTAAELVSGVRNIVTYKFDNLNIDEKRAAHIFIIDNAELLTPDEIKLICKYLRKASQYFERAKIGIIFISSKSIKFYCPGIDEILAPGWSFSELKALVIDSLPVESKIEINDQYINDLKDISGGHPLIALMLAKKHPTRESLITAIIQKPLISNEDLTEEIKEFLFNNLLESDLESMHLVLRLSALTHRASPKIFNALCKRIKPEIGKGQKLIIDKLSGILIEGDDKSGYQIAPFYKKIAESQLTKEEKTEIFKQVSAELFTPINKKLDMVEVLDGIDYCLFAGDFKKISFWTMHILHSLSKDKSSPAHNRYVLSRLELLTFININLSEFTILRNFIIIFLATNFYTLEGQQKALDILDRLSIPKGYKSDESIESRTFDLTFNLGKFYKALLGANNQPLYCLNVLNEIDFKALKDELFKGVILLDDAILNLTKYSIPLIDIDKLPNGLISKVIDYVDNNDSQVVVDLMEIASSIGIKLHKKGIEKDVINDIFSSVKSINKLLTSQVKAEYYLQAGELKEVIKYTDEIKQFMLEFNIVSVHLESKRCLMLADAFYKNKDKINSKISYKQGLEIINIDTDTSNFAWAHYRLGLLEDDPSLANHHFENSSRAFKKSNNDEFYGRSEGERAVTFFQMGNVHEFTKISENICEQFYIANKQGLAPACTCIMGQVTYLYAQITGAKLPEEGIGYPVLERGVHDKILDIAKPQAGVVTAFYSLFRLYSAIEKEDDAKRILRIALDYYTQSKNEFDKRTLPLLLFESMEKALEEANREEIIYLFNVGINYNILHHADTDISRDYVRGSLYFGIKNNLDKLSLHQRDILIRAFSELEFELLKKQGNEYFGWWLSEISYNKSLVGERDLASPAARREFWIETHKYAKKYNNVPALIDAGHHLGFIYYGYSKDPAEAFSYQTDILTGISEQNTELERLLVLGKNVFNFWKFFNFSDIQRVSIKEFLENLSLINKSADLDQEEISTLAIVLMCIFMKVSNHAFDWLVNKLKTRNTIIKISPELRVILLPYL